MGSRIHLLCDSRIHPRSLPRDPVLQFQETDSQFNAPEATVGSNLWYQQTNAQLNPGLSSPGPKPRSPPVGHVHPIPRHMLRTVSRPLEPMPIRSRPPIIPEPHSPRIHQVSAAAAKGQRCPSHTFIRDVPAVRHTTQRIPGPCTPRTWEHDRPNRHGNQGEIRSRGRSLGYVSFDRSSPET